MDWNDSFAGYVTETAFSLQLGKRQCSTLALIASGEWRNLMGASQSRGFLLNAAIGLEHKGLVERVEHVAGQSRFSIRITPAGEKVLELLELAGIVVRRTSLPAAA